MKSINTPHGTIDFPTFMPVTTFGDKFPLDKLVQPYLKRMSSCLMVSHYYAQEMKNRPSMPIFIDSGGFASLFEGSEIIDYGEYATIKTKEGDEIHPLPVLKFQEHMADMGATLDFIIPPDLAETEAKRRQELTIKNAKYVLSQRSNDNFILYGSLQCWDETSAIYCAKQYVGMGFSAIAIGGMVPHAKNPEYIKKIVRAVRRTAPDCLIHVFGIGNVNLLPELIECGADSFDSSSYVRQAINARVSDNKTMSGVHANCYAALKELSLINKSIDKASTKDITHIPNYQLCHNIISVNNIQ